MKNFEFYFFKKGRKTMKQNNLSRLFVVANVVAKNKSPRLFSNGGISKYIGGYFTRYTAYRAKGKKISEVL